MLFVKILLLLAVVSFTTPALSQSKPDDKGPDLQETEPSTPNIVPPVGNFTTVQKPIICGDPVRIFSDLQNHWKEWPLMRGQEGVIDEDNKRIVIPTYFFINPESKTYTVIQTPPNVPTIVCIIASGVLKDITEKTLEILLEEVRSQKGQES
jgi:hypothetical protein